jgi:hypothetical protein
MRSRLEALTSRVGSPATPATPVPRPDVRRLLGPHRRRKASDRTSRPDVDPPLALSNVTGAADKTRVLDTHGEHNALAELADLTKLKAQPLVGVEPALNESPDRRAPLRELPAPRPSRIASSAKTFITASRSRRFASAACLRKSSTGSDVVDSCTPCGPWAPVGPEPLQRPRSGTRARHTPFLTHLVESASHEAEGGVMHQRPSMNDGSSLMRGGES